MKGAKSMEIQQLQYFKTVAEMQHMTRAAEQLSISQPALSKSIANIEQELGIPLFDRQGRSIFLNRYGQLFLDSVHIILDEYEKVRQQFDELIRPGHGEVAFGFIHTLGMEIVPKLMAKVPEKYPHMEFSLTQATSLNLLKRLEEGGIDLCLSQELDSKIIDVEWLELWSEELYVIVPNDHPLAHRKEIELREIKDEPFISIKRGNALRQFVDQRFKEAGLVPNTTFAGEEMHTIAGFVSSGLGVSIIPHIKGLESFEVTKISVTPTCLRKIGVASARNRYLSPAANEFKVFLIDYFKGEF